MDAKLSGQKLDKNQNISYSQNILRYLIITKEKNSNFRVVKPLKSTLKAVIKVST